MKWLCSRRIAHLLLWLAVALLPARGWAHAVMPLPDATGSALSAVPAQFPCHTDVDAAGGSDDASVGCALCDLCHTPMAVAPALPDSPDLLPPVRPQARPAPAIEPAIRSGPDRPPRSVRA